MAPTEPPAIPSPPSAWRRRVGFLFAAAALAFLVAFVARNFREVRAYDWAVRLDLLLLSLLIHILGLAWGVRVWQLLLRRMEGWIEYRDLARVWFLSGLGRYLPGKIWQFVGAAHLGSISGIPPVLTVTSLAVHTGFFLLAALLVAAIFLPISAGDVAGMPVETLRWLTPLLLLLVHPAVLRRALRLLRKFARRDLASWTAGWIDGVWLLTLAAIGWVITGAAFFLFLLALAPLPSVAAPAIVGINAFAFAVGYLVFIAPAGLGAKEGALAAMLALYLPASVAVLLAIAARLWTVAAEVIPAALLLPGRARPPPAEKTRR